MENAAINLHFAHTASMKFILPTRYLEALLILILIMNDDHDNHYEHHLHTSRQSSSQTKSYLHVIV